MPALLVENRGVMALVVFLRGVNVGGHRTFRPSLLANELSDFDVVNVGAAGTFVVRNPDIHPAPILLVFGVELFTDDCADLPSPWNVMSGTKE